MDWCAIITDSLKDALNLFVFLLMTYLVLEYWEQKGKARSLALISRAGFLGPVGGALAGLIPQCGFSAAAANFFAARVITGGTLLAVFLSTSDEMLPILISKGVATEIILKIMGLKFVIAVLAGWGYNLIKREQILTPDMESLCEREDCHCEDGGIFKAALMHAVKITLFVLIISIILGSGIEFWSKYKLDLLIFSRPISGPMITALIGLIPNCSASVAITQMWAEGIITFGELAAGVLAGGGIGLLVLFRVNANRWENVKIAVILYLIAAISGIIIDFLPINL
ncbi:MAG: arsenic efflux protein [Alphaproteobacteria bacterium]|nr:arsenic efflux protein [Alphaproteobacteria bacterium]